MRGLVNNQVCASPVLQLQGRLLWRGRFSACGAWPLTSGYSSAQLRARVWPVLLGVDALPFDEAAYQAQQGTRHRDSSTVECDVERSLWSYTEGAALLFVMRKL